MTNCRMSDCSFMSGLVKSGEC